MNKQEFINAIVRLASSHKLGLKEAALLFLTADGATTQELAVRAGVSPPTINSRLQILRAKRLIVTRFDPDGTRRICPTKDGLAIIKRTINPPIK